MSSETSTNTLEQLDISEIIDEIPTEEKINELIEQRIEMHAGPIPHPDLMASYEKITPGLADRIMKMAEQNQEANIEHQKNVLNFQARDAYNDQRNIYKITRLIIISCLLVLFLFIGGGFYLILQGHVVSGLFASFGGITPVLYVFMKMLIVYKKPKKD